MLDNHTIKAVIIDDEAAARDTLSALIREFFPEITVMGVARDGEEGLTVVVENNLQAEAAPLCTYMGGELATFQTQYVSHSLS